MTFIRTHWRWAALAALVAWIALGAWLMLIQAFLALWDPLGHWHMPHLAKVSITQVSRDTDGKYTGQVLAKEGDKDRVLLMAVEEAARLDADDEVWVLDHYRAEGNRPSHYVATPLRLLLEYPEPSMLLALWLLTRVRRGQKAAQAKALEPPPGGRKVWTDDFHQRAQRFAPKDVSPTSPASSVDLPPGP